MIVAKHYVKHNGRLYAAGEIIEGLPSDKLKRLIALGAVAEIDNTPRQPEEEVFPMPVPEEPEVTQEIDVADGVVQAKPTKKRGRGKAK